MRANICISTTDCLQSFLCKGFRSTVLKHFSQGPRPADQQKSMVCFLRHLGSLHEERFGRAPMRTGHSLPSARILYPYFVDNRLLSHYGLGIPNLSHFLRLVFGGGCAIERK
jgi:hypothetical protein